jgi:peptidyl-prolyl cis-trans isomerase SurA
MRRTTHRTATALALGAALLAGALAPRVAEAVVVEKIVAVVGDDAILLSELRDRGRPFVRLMHKQVPAGPQRAAAESKIYEDVLEKMIEETLVQQAAERGKVELKPGDLERAFENLAAQNKTTVEDLIASTEEKTGMTEAQYRAEIRRQILEGQMLSQRVRGRMRIGEEDLKNAFARAQREERDRREYRPAWIVLRVLPGSSEQAIAERFELARELRTRALGGEPFAELARRYSDDAATREQGGDLGIRAPSKSQLAQTGRRTALAPEIEERLLGLEIGQIAEPFRVADAIVVATVLRRAPSKYTTLEAAKPELVQRVQNELVTREKAAWLDELKKRVHVDRRL